MRVVVIHNLAPGGAHRRLREQLGRFEAETIEVCLATAEPVSAGAHVIPFEPRAPRFARALRVPLRYADLGALVRAWEAVSRHVRGLRADVVYANPCRYLQAPAALIPGGAPALYFCDEPRRIDHDPVAIGSRNPVTRPVYASMYAAERRLDRRAVAAASAVATNSDFSAAAIARAYGRTAEVVRLGVGEPFLSAPSRQDGHLLSVGTLIPSKGHDLVIAAAALTRAQRRVIVVSPRDDAAEAERLRGLAAARGVGLELRAGIPDAELAGLYAGAHATLYLAAGEPFGLASLEAQAAGSPVIVAAEGGLPETLGPGQREWATPRVPAAIAARLEALEDPDARAAAVAAGRAHAARASWEASARTIERRLGELCA
jgi:glycosyltransferase involved in cell wall biosynthesis